MKHLIKTALFLLALIIPATALAHDFEVDGIYYNINGTTATVTYRGTSPYQYQDRYSGSVSIPSTVIYGGTTYPVTAIGDWAFSDCSSLTTINIPNTVTSIGRFAFDNCTSLTNINIPNSVTDIGSWAFSGTAWFDNQPDGVVYAGLVAYGYKGDMPEGTSITLREGTTGIADDAFYWSSLTSINIPNSIIAIGESAFYWCTNLAAISVASNNPKYDSRNNCNAIIETASNTLIAGCNNTTIPNSVTSIGDMAFGGSGITIINIPNSVTHIGEAAFIGCQSLRTINIGNSVSTIGADAFYYRVCYNDIYSYATTPPDCKNDLSFENKSATLHVPAASLAAYFTAPVWSEFETILGDAVAPTDITISKDRVDMPLGEQIELTATVTPANASCKDVTWYSTDTSVAIVENGIVTTIGYGECDIFAYCMGMPAVCHITVANRISLEQNEAMLLPNHMLVLNPTAPAMPAGFTVMSSDPTVAAARVMNGKVQIVGIKEGTTTITVSSSDGTAQPATCLVTVYTESGDANCDGFVNVNDVTDLIDYLLGSETTSFKEGNVDLNGDGKINVADVAALIDQLLATNE